MIFRTYIAIAIVTPEITTAYLCPPGMLFQKLLFYGSSNTKKICLHYKQISISYGSSNTKNICLYYKWSSISCFVFHNKSWNCNTNIWLLHWNNVPGRRISLVVIVPLLVKILEGYGHPPDFEKSLTDNNRQQPYYYPV